MATKSKSNKVLKNLMCVLLIVALTTSALLFYPTLQERMKKFEKPLWQTSYAANELMNYSWNLYWQMELQNGQATLEELLAPEFMEETHKLEEQIKAIEKSDRILWENTGVQYAEDETASLEVPQEIDPIEGQQPAVTVEPKPAEPGRLITQEEYDVLTWQLRARKDAINSWTAQLEQAAWKYSDMNYWCKDAAGKTISQGNVSSDLFAGSQKQQEERLKEYQFAVKLRFDSEGKVHVDDLWTDHQDAGDFVRNMENNNFDNTMTYTQPEYVAQEICDVKQAVEMQGPRNITMILAFPYQLETTSGWYQDMIWNKMGAFESAGGGVLYAGVLIVAALLGLLLGAVRQLDMGNGRFMRWMPVEGFIFLDVFVVLAFIPMERYAVELLGGQEIRIAAERWMMDYTLLRSGAEVGHMLFWAAIITAAFVSFLSYGKLFAMGLWPYLKERSWIVRFVLWIVKGSKNLWKKVTEVSLDAPARKALGGIILVNLGVMVVASGIWFFGIPVAMLYSVFLYVFLKKRYRQVQTDYQKVTDLADQMAQGNLDAVSEEDAGMFQPLTEQLAQVRSGFKKAVDAEVRSQKMKTELITNVSHDLKTPLTAIITYVDLLKKPDITPEERAEYVETLDKKSQRLKQLIADLFEVSKAASRDVSLHMEQLDLCALLGQVRFELSDELEECGVDFRWELPEEKIFVQLDGPHTCRIFENLLINITKYAMQGTRAYITMRRTGQEVQVSFKNISAAELNLTERDLTERFVRGDVSRSTEGSGLGLAIAKSFTELQNGRFVLAGDGDLFKVVITWKCDDTTPLKRETEQEPGAIPVMLPETF